MRRVAGLDWRLALLIAVCFVLAAMAVTNSRRLPAEHKRPRVQARQEPKDSVKGEKPPEGIGQVAGDWLAFTDQIISAPPSREVKDQTKQGNDEGAEYWPAIFGLRIKITDSLIVLLTGALAIYTRELNRSTLKLWEAGERQIRIARISARAATKANVFNTRVFGATQRPWISIIAESVTGGLSVDDVGATVKIKFVLKNSGNLPASGVLVQDRSYLTGFGGGLPTAARHELLEQTRKLRSYDFGHALFPGDEFSVEIDCCISREHVEGFNASDQASATFVIAAINYRAAIDSEPHQTATIFTIQQRVSEQWNIDFSPVLKNIGADNLRIVRHYMGTAAN